MLTSIPIFLGSLVLVIVLLTALIRVADDRYDRSGDK
ncbi:hypothetical protein CcrC1_gp476 [Caulobacter phage C1]|nr:hypothetical protein CcrC1_gp476 [Caulobacter phage C1]UTU08685.1 hypothetical protein CcrC2_gp458 [Caulobacter phage C2]WGN97351.1 hypothetical protein [Bertelyvirus sp.]WGN97889.1 hypothetical protein [Bertelyvirus sp.]